MAKEASRLLREEEADSSKGGRESLADASSRCELVLIGLALTESASSRYYESASTRDSALSPCDEASTDLALSRCEQSSTLTETALCRYEQAFCLR